jgi:hypothetical protein
MPKKPQLLEGSQSLREHRRLGEGEESAPCRLESVIIERNCDKLSESLRGSLMAHRVFTFRYVVHFILPK